MFSIQCSPFAQTLALKIFHWKWIKYIWLMGHISHLRNQFKWVKIWLYIYYKIDPVLQVEKILKFCECIFCNFVFISLCRKVWLFLLNKLKSPSPRDAFCQVWLKLVQWFYIRCLNFYYFVNISPWENAWLYILINLYIHLSF